MLDGTSADEYCTNMASDFKGALALAILLLSGPS